jgi:hypothetical protein
MKTGKAASCSRTEKTIKRRNSQQICGVSHKNERPVLVSSIREVAGHRAKTVTDELGKADNETNRGRARAQ